MHIYPTPRRILLKLSGELLSSDHSNFHLPSVERIISSIQETFQDGIREIGVVIGGGNLFRGREAHKLGVRPYVADRVGMLATCMNALILKECLEKVGLSSVVMGDFYGNPTIESYSIDKAKKALSSHHIVIFANGLAQPFFTTDTAAVVRAQEIEADLVVKATKVPGVFDKDPCLHTDAKRYTTLTFLQAISHKLQVMDETAFCLLHQAKLPLFVYSFGSPNSIYKALNTKETGTWVVPDDTFLTKG